MIRITCLQDLREFGIRPLTGEADNLMYRMLCDLTEQGRKIVAETYGIYPAGFPENMNLDGAVASCMLPHDAWQHVAPIALLQRCYLVIATDRQVIGLETGDEYKPAPYDWEASEYTGPVRVKLARYDEWIDWPEGWGKIGRTFSFGSHPRVGSRNVHQMTGRAM